MSSRKNGFTLIELMITVAIIGILASIAMSSYQDYLVRSQISEALVLMGSQKSIVLETYSQTGICPTSGTEGIHDAISTQGEYTEQVALGGGAPNCSIVATIRGTASPMIAGLTLTLIAPNSGSLAWTCTSNILQKYVPKTCIGA